MPYPQLIHLPPSPPSSIVTLTNVADFMNVMSSDNISEKETNDNGNNRRESPAENVLMLDKDITTSSSKDINNIKIPYLCFALTACTLWTI
mmetsp:Transcript_22000/g.40355  ORF Transcript_22000/g.40355 Transcript_22000/m.40355 type:complete len:91 (-) Transcript_22000:15-287(-)